MYTTYTQGCFSFNFCPECQITSIECSRNNIFSATYFVKVCLIRSRERRQNLTTFKNCAVELSCDHLDFLLKYYQSDHRSGFQFTCESIIWWVGYSAAPHWLLVLPWVKKIFNFSQCVCTFANSREFSSFEICKGFHLCIDFFFAYFVFTKLHEKQNITFFVTLLWASIPLPLASVLFRFWFWFQFDFHPQVTPGPSLNERQMSKQIYF